MSALSKHLRLFKMVVISSVREMIKRLLDAIRIDIKNCSEASLTQHTLCIVLFVFGSFGIICSLTLSS